MACIPGPPAPGNINPFWIGLRSRHRLRPLILGTRGLNRLLGRVGLSDRNHKREESFALAGGNEAMRPAPGVEFSAPSPEPSMARSQRSGESGQFPAPRSGRRDGLGGQAGVKPGRNQDQNSGCNDQHAKVKTQTEGARPRGQHQRAHSVDHVGERVHR